MERVSVKDLESVDAYLEYRRIVGDDDNGELFTEQEYEDYKKRVLPMRLKNRVFVSWTSPTGMDCKLVGPETPCFCSHRYKQHKTDFTSIPEERPILVPCRAQRCRCVSYNFVPMNGSQPIRCICKHTSEDHSEIGPYFCKKVGCSKTKCLGFKSSFTCSCGQPTFKHSTIIETKDEREARGHPVGQDVPYQAMGGITGFSSLAEGYQRLDPSGRGAPSTDFLNQPITSSDHPFLRANARNIDAYRALEGHTGPSSSETSEVDNVTEQMSAMRRPGEDDMEYFERRYQERKNQRHVPIKPLIVSKGKRNVAKGKSNKD